jgi:hypothetical protein
MFSKLFVVILVSAAVLAGCTENAINNALTNEKNSFVVNGSGYTEAKFKGYTADTASVAREVTGSSALVVISGLTTKTGETFGLSMSARSNVAGSYQINGAEGTTMTLVIMNGSSPITYIATSGSITIDSWGSVGGRVKGSFSGSLALQSDLANNVKRGS